MLAQIRDRQHEDRDQSEPQPAPKRHAGKTPRALGVLEIREGNARLLPVSILIDGKFYDASVYKADPQPMAVEPETVYEGQKTGDPVGLFTVTQTQQVNGNWVGLGLWDVKKPGETPAPKSVKVGAPPSDRPRGMDDDEGPPKLRRPGSSGPADKTSSTQATTSAPAAGSAPTQSPASSTQQAPASSPTASAPASDHTASSDKSSADSKQSGRPTLARGDQTQPDSTPATDTTPRAQTDSKPAAQAEPKTAAPSSSQSDEDAAHPVLRRGNKGGVQADRIPAPPNPVTKGAATRSNNADTRGLGPSVGYTDTLAAISDAGGPTPRSFTIMLKPDERTGYEQKMDQYASDAIRKFAVTHPIRDRQAANVALTDVQMRVFDVNSSNEPVLVLTARAPESAAAPAPAKPGVRTTRSGASQATSKQGAQAASAPATSSPPAVAHPSPSGEGASAEFQYYVTVVARVDVNGDVRKLFDLVTDSSHLDAIPRLQLIDCVDANGDGVGELLFREHYDRSRAYAIYRVGMDQLWQLFEGAQTSFSAGQ